jgi:hypothetical protein
MRKLFALALLALALSGGVAAIATVAPAPALAGDDGNGGR